MTLTQLRYLVAIADSRLNITQAAERVHATQPGLSKQLKQLEDELGFQLFTRRGRSLESIAPAGVRVIEHARKVLAEVANIRSYAANERGEYSGRLLLATTHTQARYVLPQIVQQFMRRHPNVRVSLHQGSPTEVCDFVLAGEADLAIATEAIGEQDDLVMLPCYQWNRCVIAPPEHPILKAKPLTLEAIARYPIITYDFAFTGRSQINKAFAARGLTPNVVLTAIDADIIKTYVALGLGIGIVAYMAYDPAADKGLRAVDAAHLFESATTRIGIRRNAWLRSYVFDFIELFAPHLTRKMVMAGLAGFEGSDPGL